MKMQYEYEETDFCTECGSLCRGNKNGLCTECQTIHENEDMMQMIAIENQIDYKGGVFCLS